MRFVVVKSEGQQARGMLFRTRDLLVRQRTQLINALRGHLSEHGVVAAQGPANVKVLEEGNCQVFCVSSSREMLYVVERITEYGTSNQRRAD